MVYHHSHWSWNLSFSAVELLPLFQVSNWDVMTSFSGEAQPCIWSWFCIWPLGRERQTVKTDGHCSYFTKVSEFCNPEPLLVSPLTVHDNLVFITIKVFMAHLLPLHPCLMIWGNEQQVIQDSLKPFLWSYRVWFSYSGWALATFILTVLTFIMWTECWFAEHT